MGSTVIACIDKHLDGRSPVDAAAVNRLNRKARAELGPNELASEQNKRWPDGQELRIAFLDGAPEVHARVVEHAKRWQPYVNLSLSFGNFPDAEVRISFREPGYWSFVGMDAAGVAQDRPTMSFGGWSAESLPSDVVIKRTVLHELGHAFGCVHEHQAPAAGIPWNVDKVIHHYLVEQGWAPAYTRIQVLQKYDAAAVRATEWDPKSIMQYPVDKSLTDGTFEIPWNDDLSPKDVAFIQEMYPKR